MKPQRLCFAELAEFVSVRSYSEDTPCCAAWPSAMKRPLSSAGSFCRRALLTLLNVVGEILVSLVAIGILVWAIAVHQLTELPVIAAFAFIVLLSPCPCGRAGKARLSYGNTDAGATDSGGSGPQRPAMDVGRTGYMCSWFYLSGGFLAANDACEKLRRSEYTVQALSFGSDLGGHFRNGRTIVKKYL